MTKYIYTPNGLQNQETGEIEPFRRDGPVCLPQIMRGDDQEPLVSMADGKTYTSKAAMRESYKAKNNPKGVDYDEIGTERIDYMHKPKQFTKAEVSDSVAKAEAAINRGEYDHVL